jgi:hypothetical protein
MDAVLAPHTDDNPDVIAFPGPVTQIQRQAGLAGLIN